MPAAPRRLLQAIFLLALLGILVSAYAAYQHYRPAGTSFCNINSAVSCDIVNKSRYSEIAGVPVAVIGILGYALLAAIALALWKGAMGRGGIVLLALMASGALVFSLYLTFIEFFRLGALCPLCITSQILIAFIFIISFSLWRAPSKSLPSSL